MVNKSKLQLVLSKIDYNILRNNVFSFLNNVKVNTTSFRMAINATDSIYSSIFALYIFDLFGEVKKWDNDLKHKWGEKINSYQDRKSGLFLPEVNSRLFSKQTLQLTAFSISALEILDKNPKYEFNFLNTWKTEEDIYSYLEQEGCWKGKPGSGNMAMFLAIFLTTTYRKYNSVEYLDLINAWFVEHNKNQNTQTGFWEKLPVVNPYNGFQNGFHQLIIYNYWQREVRYYKHIVDILLLIQAPDGSFWSYPGGGACYDYDAVNILINQGLKNGYRVNDIYGALEKVIKHVMILQNTDGGFCENKNHPSSFENLFSLNTLKFLTASQKKNIFYTRLKSCVREYVKKNKKQKTHFCDKSISWENSDLWSTWFRLLIIAETSNALLADDKWTFLKSIGIGWSKKSNEWGINGEGFNK